MTSLTLMIASIADGIALTLIKMCRLILIGIVAFAVAACDRSEVAELPEGRTSTTDREEISRYLNERTGCALPKTAKNFRHERSWGNGEKHESVEFDISDEGELEDYFYELVQELPRHRKPSSEDESLFIYGIGGHQKWTDLSFAQQSEYDFQFGSDTDGHWESIRLSKRTGSITFYRQTW